MGSPSERPLYVLGFDRAVAIRVSGYGVVLLFVALQLSDAMADSAATAMWFSGASGALVFIATVVGTVVAHELVHGAFFALFGSSRPRFGVGIAGGFVPYAYATAPGQRFGLAEFTIIGVAPFVLLSIASIGLAAFWPASAPIATTAFVVNFSGACGDLWIVSQIWRFRGSDALRFEDLRDAVAVYAKGERARATADRLGERRRSRWTRFVTVAALASIVTFALTSMIPVVLLVLGVRNFTIGPEAFPLVAVSRGADGATATIGVLPALVAGVVFAALYVMLRSPRRPAATVDDRP